MYTEDEVRKIIMKAFIAGTVWEKYNVRDLTMLEKIREVTEKILLDKAEKEVV